MVTDLVKFSPKESSIKNMQYRFLFDRRYRTPCTILIFELMYSCPILSRKRRQEVHLGLLYQSRVEPRQS